MKHKKPLFYNFIYDFTKVIAGFFGVLWHRPKILYESPKAKEKIRGGAILIANHIGFLDPVYMMYALWYRRHRFIVMKEVMDSKAGWLLRQFHCIAIDRENVGMGTFREITGHLKDGQLVSMFPEGHIGQEEGQMQTFKSGMVLMAATGGVPIVPMYIRKRKNIFKRLTMVVGEPVTIPGRPGMKEIENITRLLYEKEEMLKNILEEESL